MAVIVGNDDSEQISVYGVDNIFYGMGGNDVFAVSPGVQNAHVSGTNSTGDLSGTQTDVVILQGSASFSSILAIDLLTFAYSSPATTITYNANSFFGVSQVYGSSAGTDTILFKSASEAVNLDLSKTTFANWKREEQTIKVELNTDRTVALDDRFVGSTAGEHVSAGKGRDLLYGNRGDDFLDGGDGIDVLDGGDGNDTLIGGGGEGPNILKGGKGNDVYKFREKVDIIIDSGGLDSRVVSRSTTLSVKDKFEGLAADEALSASKSVNLTGTNKANMLLGHAGRNALKGLAGNDIIDGRAGSDVLYGDAGNDRLSGGLGKDVLNGGVGKDTFIFDKKLSSSNVDRIIDFSRGNDRIALEKDIFNALSGGTLTSSAFYVGTKARDSYDRIIYNKKTGDLFYDADGSGGAVAQIKFATLAKNLKLAASDFLLI